MLFRSDDRATYGGKATHITHVANELHKRGYEVHIATPNKALFQDKVENGIYVKEYAFNNEKVKKEFVYNLNNEGYDVVNAHVFATFVILLLNLPHRNFRLIITDHVGVYNAQEYECFKEYFEETKKADAVVTVSLAGRRIFYKAGHRENKLHTIHNGVPYQKENVYEAFNHRLDYICNYFDHLIISFSGGKDSGLMLELVYLYYKSHKLAEKGIKVSVFCLDYEGNYQETKDYIHRSMGKYPEFEYYHICLPVSASCGISMSQSTWLPWDPDHKELWLNTIPKGAIHLENQDFSFFKVGMSDYDFQSKFCQWLHNEKGATRTAVLVGIRAQESLNRYNAVTRDETFSRRSTRLRSFQNTPFSIPS